MEIRRGTPWTRLPQAWIPLIALALASCAGTRETLEPARNPKREALVYPTFEASTSSRMFGLIGGDLDRVDLREGVETLEKIEAASASAKAFAAGFDGPRGGNEATAELLPKIPPAEKPLYAFVPVVMMKLEPLWHTASWSADQVDLANQASTLIGRLGGAPAPAFEIGADAANRAGLECLVRWFYAARDRPELLAAMVFTLDDGPFVGLPYAARSALPTRSRQPIDDHLELRLARVEGEREPWVMQCLRDGELVWTRIVSGRPVGDVAHVGFYASAEASNLGSYGWHVPFWVNWTYGREQAHLYLDPEGDLLFYFLSW